ncbi:tail fiber domain-containing protein [Enterovirga aerilata]|uniref:Tail fiber domain-containing protein n=1 Tax=Enterovirga aerilata TaxID=2730920 RepID=A0A849I5K5_9HYPH|nr:tail fiber domain-containing protein [Enterovirga sp. DB1703]NNM74742.1 tail fiber domain-containing protein [Enterovirga sp. DB1703]
MGKPRQPSTQTVINETRLPAWVEQAGQENMAFATNVANNLKPYELPNVVGFNRDQQAAFDMARQGYAQAEPGLNAAQATLAQAAGYNPVSVTPQQISGTNVGTMQITGSNIGATDVNAGQFSAEALAKYMNPYTDQVVSNALSDLDRSRVAALTQTGDQAAAAGAFGGSRQGIMEAVTNAESARAAGILSAQLRSNAFDKAAGLLGTDQNRALQADLANQGAQLQAALANQATGLDVSKSNAAQFLQAQLANQANAFDVARTNQAADLTAQQSNQQAGLAGNTQRLAAGTQQAALAQQNMQSWLQQAAVNQGIGDAQQAQAQQEENLRAARANTGNDHLTNQLNVRLAALSATPYGKTTTTTGPATTQGSNPLLGALGGAATGASIASTLGLTSALGGYGGLAGAGLGGLLGLLALSDEREKTDMRKVGKDPDTGLDLYAFRFKGDPKTYPKVVGPLAQDIEKKFPDQVERLGGKKGVLAVQRNFLNKMAA